MKKYLILLLIIYIPIASISQDKEDILYYKSEKGTYMEIDMENKRGRICDLNVSDMYVEIICDVKLLGSDTLQLYGKTDYHYFQKHCEKCEVPVYCHLRSYTPSIFWTYKIVDGGQKLEETPKVKDQLNFLDYTSKIPIAFLPPSEMMKTDKVNYNRVPKYARKSAKKRKLK